MSRGGAEFAERVYSAVRNLGEKRNHETHEKSLFFVYFVYFVVPLFGGPWTMRCGFLTFVGNVRLD